MSINIDEMKLPELYQNIKDNLEAAEKIERKYQDGIITSKEDEKQVKLHLTLVDQMEQRVSLVEDATQRRNRITSGLEKYTNPAPSTLRP